jgi:hypothetical protein
VVVLPASDDWFVTIGAVSIVCVIAPVPVSAYETVDPELAWSCLPPRVHWTSWSSAL